MNCGLSVRVGSTLVIDGTVSSSSIFVKPRCYSPFAKIMADGKGRSAYYLNAMTGDCAPSSGTCAPSFRPVSSNDGTVSSSSIFVKPRCYSPFGEIMADGKGRSVYYLNAITVASAPSAKAFASGHESVPSNVGSISSSYSAANPSSYSACGKKIADGKEVVPI